MEVYLTRHAKNRMRLYEILQKSVEATAQHPDHVTAGAFGASHAWKRVAPGQWLRVTFMDEGRRRIVVTVTPKAHGPGGAHAH